MRYSASLYGVAARSGLIVFGILVLPGLSPIGSLLSAQSGTRMLRSPSVSGNSIAFTYANNIWVVDRAGGNARRISSFQGTTQSPRLSRDGKLVAFSADYSGNTELGHLYLGHILACELHGMISEISVVGVALA